ncbi:protein of unknown function [Kyrpidia spormannii]|uniref:Uncharacterized protein n=1 Tax=Kyrpidia spormannii TaxID=2055160 RepID=A0ACA8ZCB8_9BACL|nr:protein of unknown function [Kyrpidia spormannii]
MLAIMRLEDTRPQAVAPSWAAWTVRSGARSRRRSRTTPGSRCWLQPTRRARGSTFSVRTSWLNDDLPWNRSRIERRFERMHRIKRPIGFIESHATGNDTGGKARGDILTYGRCPPVPPGGSERRT